MPEPAEKLVEVRCLSGGGTYFAALGWHFAESDTLEKPQSAARAAVKRYPGELEIVAPQPAARTTTKE